ncbi:MAG: PilZ domain-containing protein [Lachnospiraceae bacterium]|nr:PilZ domain-containing protein [Lachnospiraceae bacterium]
MEKILKLGMHVEMIKTGLTLDALENMDKKFISSLHEIVSDDTLILTNPTIRTRLVPLHKGERYDGYFFLRDKIYMAGFVVEKSFTEGNVRVVQVRLTSDLKKYERRQFFRFETTMDIRYLLLTAENTSEFKEAVKKNNLLQMQGFEVGTTLDISGGGIRFYSKELLPEGGMAIIHMGVEVEGQQKNHTFLGKVLYSERHRDNRNIYIHRIQFVDYKQDVREELVQYIFKCQRDRLKKQNSLN